LGDGDDGDPLLGLAGFCEIWNSSAGARVAPRSAMVERHRMRRGISSLDDLTYYDVLYNFRLSVLLEGIYNDRVRIQPSGTSTTSRTECSPTSIGHSPS
jgi:aminoglycoside phosphotransferase (APT) family kinase protein